ncbi:hypothetical protein [Janibacter corallicola]|uniref:hypothetical protein n=1 Tax=Janibacter corallicola TaxID=415212 RepID=UPI00083550C8|nr:hypothetical protein [Janibacter corallicola]
MAPTSSASPTAPATAHLALGATSIVLGGLVAAVTGPFGWEKGSWAAAYLVLVTGAAQYVMGRRRAGARAPDRDGWLQLAAWDLGSLAVLLGVLVRQPPVVDLGSVVLLLGLALALRTDLRLGAGSRAVTVGYRLLLLVLLVSIPVGMLLTHLRSG